MKKETRKEIEGHLSLLREESKKLASKKLTGNSAVELAFMDNAIVAVETLLSLSPQDTEDMLPFQDTKDMDTSPFQSNDRFLL